MGYEPHLVRWLRGEGAAAWTSVWYPYLDIDVVLGVGINLIELVTPEDAVVGA